MIVPKIFTFSQLLALYRAAIDKKYRVSYIRFVPSFLEKSDANFACAEHLYDSGPYLCNSIAHYYYSVLQTMMHIVAINEPDRFGDRKSGNQLYKDAKANNQTTHEYIQNSCFLKYLRSQIDPYDLSQLKKQFENLRELRVELEYREKDMHSSVEKAKSIAQNLKIKLHPHATE